MNATSTEKTVTTLQAVFNKARATVVSESELFKAIKACPDDEKIVARAVYAGRMVIGLGVTQEAALLILGLKVWNKDESKNTDNHRTEKQEKAYTAARVWFTTFKARWGLSKPKASPEKDDDTSDMDVSKLKAAPKQKVSDVAQLAAYCVADASRDYDFFLLNKGHVAIASELGAELMGAYADMLNTVKEIVAKHAPKVEG